MNDKEKVKQAHKRIKDLMILVNTMRQYAQHDGCMDGKECCCGLKELEDEFNRVVGS